MSVTVGEHCEGTSEEGGGQRQTREEPNAAESNSQSSEVSAPMIATTPPVSMSHLAATTTPGLLVTALIEYVTNWIALFLLKVVLTYSQARQYEYLSCCTWGGFTSMNEHAHRYGDRMGQERKAQTSRPKSGVELSRMIPTR